MIVVGKTSWNLRSLTNFHAIKYIKSIIYFIIIWENVSKSDGMKIYKYEKTQGLQRMILSIVELLYDVSSDLKWNFIFVKWNDNVLNILFPLVALF